MALTTEQRRDLALKIVRTGDYHWWADNRAQLVGNHAHLTIWCERQRRRRGERRNPQPQRGSPDDQADRREIVRHVAEARYEVS
jgi:hypothetical protein